MLGATLKVKKVVEKLLFFAPQLSNMKKLPLLSLLLIAFVAFSCGGGEKSENQSSEKVATETLPSSLARGTMLLDLSDYFIPFSLYVPDSNRGIPNILETGYGETEIEVGTTFHIMVAEGGNVADKKVSLAGELMYTNEIIEEGTDFMLYKSTIKDSHLEPEFHFYAVKQINGVDFEFRDYSNEGGFAETVARFMLESINHLVPNNSPS
jgi:hypothetical protein